MARFDDPILWLRLTRPSGTKVHMMIQKPASEIKVGFSDDF